MNGDVNKLAFILNDDENKYVVTIDGKYTINPGKKYFEKDDGIDIEFYSSISDVVNIKDEKTELEIGILENYNEESRVIKNDGRWLLLKDDTIRGKEVGYSICYCTDENVDISIGKKIKSDNLICFKTSYDIKESKAKEEYENVKSNIEVYNVEKNDGIVEYKNVGE